jgi:protein-tyrosine-phosphatase
MCSDPENEEDFRVMLAKYNGTYQDHNTSKEKPHVLVFDDADKIINSPSPALKALMKKITDNNPKNRIFINPKTKKSEVFKGAILIMTNKDLAALAKNPDTNAILTRGRTNNIKLTRAESMSVISDRYKEIKLADFQEAFEDLFPDPDDQLKVREEVYSWIEDNVNDADPVKFSPRTFIQVMQLAAPAIAKGDSGVRFTSGGVQVGASVPWQIQALEIIKAQDINIEKAWDDDEVEAVAVKKELLAAKKKAKKNKKRYSVMYGDNAMDAYYFGSDCVDTKKSNEKAKKAFENEMSLDEAEDLLFG